MPPDPLHGGLLVQQPAFDSLLLSTCVYSLPNPKTVPTPMHIYRYIYGLTMSGHILICLQPIYLKSLSCGVH